MRKFSANVLLELPREKWPCADKEKFIICYDNGEELETNTYRTEISKFLWSALDDYPLVKLRPEHHIGGPGVPVSNDRIQSVQSAMYEDIHWTYVDRKGFNREEAWLKLYKSSELLYNRSIVDYSEYVRGLTSFDINRLYKYPPIKEIREKTFPNDGSIAKGYEAAKQILMNDPAIARNPVISDLRAGLMKMEQLLQIILYRGFNTDIGDEIYRVPIMGNYHQGILDPAEAMMESTLGAKAIIFQGQPLEQTEVANRRIQFSAATVDLLIMGDCGSTVLGKVEVTKERLKGLNGSYYRNPEGRGEYTAIRTNDKHLIGQTLEFRFPHACAWREKNCVCSTCYGLLAYSIPYGANIGHIAGTNTQSKVSQRVLKVKHSEQSTTAKRIVIGNDERPYILPAEAPNQIRLNPELKKHGIRMVLRTAAQPNAFNGSKLPIISERDLLDPGQSMARFSQFREVTFDVPTDKRQPLRYHVSVSRGTKTSNLTREFLQFFVSKKFKIQNDGKYLIELDDWDFSQPVFELPNKHSSMKDFASEVEVFIRSSRDSSDKHLGKLKQLKQYEDPIEAMLDLYDLITTEVPVLFTHISVIMLSMMVHRDVRDYRIPALGVPFRFAKYDEVVNNRSLGPVAAYQKMRDVLRNPAQYINTERCAHLLDPILCPVPD